MHGFLDDLRAATRALLRAPGFCAVAVGTLAIGIAVNAAMFAVVYAIFFRPPPYPDPQLLHNLEYSTHALVAGSQARRPTLAELESSLASFGELAGYSEERYAIVSEAAPDRSYIAPGVLADPELFAVLQVAPRLGRSFSVEDGRPGARPTVIVTEAFRRAQMGESGNPLGQTIRINGIDRIVIGVMPAGFSFPEFSRIYVPLTQPETRRLGADVNVLVRLHHETARQPAMTALKSVLSQTDTSAMMQFRSLSEPADAAVVALIAAIGFVLLIACSNVANLVLARGLTRRYELGVRSALGATRARLLRYLTIEGALLSSAAVLAGTIASMWLVDLLVSNLPVTEVPAWFDTRPDARMLAYVAGLGTVTVLVAALLPAFTLTRTPIGSMLLHSSTRTTGSRSASRLRSTLVGLQIAMAMALLVSTGLMVRAFREARTYDPGYAAASVMEIATWRHQVRSPDRFADQVIARLNDQPGVAAAGALTGSPLSGELFRAGTERGWYAMVDAVSPAALAALNLPLQQGRSFQSGVGDGRVLLLSETAARALFDEPDGAIGASLTFENDSAGARFTVIGIVADRGLPHRFGTRLPYVYVPLRYGVLNDLRFIARAQTGSPLQLMPAVSAAIRAVDPSAVIQPARTMLDAELERADQLGWFASLFAGFGATAVLLAFLGVYAVVTYTVGRRTREFGVRIALGATSNRIRRHVLSSILPATAYGLVAGLMLAIVMGSLLRGQLFGVAPVDPISLATALGLFLVVTLAAAWLPARRAAQLEPQQALRAE